MNGFTAWLQQLDFSIFYDYGVVILASLLCIMFHEVSHGLCALAMGDTTARDAGRLTFNPLKHIDLWGLLMMAVFKFGWAKPVPINMRRFRRPVLGMALTALAGPVSNIILAFLALCVRSAAVFFYYQSGGAVAEFIILFTEYVAILSVGLAIFNIIPIPPLDGSKVLFALLPKHLYYKLMRVEKYGFVILMVVLYLGVLDTPLAFCRTALINGLSAISTFPFYILQHFFG